MTLSSAEGMFFVLFLSLCFAMVSCSRAADALCVFAVDGSCHSATKWLVAVEDTFSDSPAEIG